MVHPTKSLASMGLAQARPNHGVNHCYLLVVMDYFTKWADAIPLYDQKATTITDAVVKICSNFGMPEILRSDQGRNSVSPSTGNL